MNETVVYCEGCGEPVRANVGEHGEVEWIDTCRCLDAALERQAGAWDRARFAAAHVVRTYEEMARAQARMDAIDAQMEKAREEQDYSHFRTDI